MRLKISHRTEYGYDAPLSYGLQRLRLTPQSGRAQTVITWEIAVDGAREELRYIDGFGNETRLISIEGEPRSVAITATGEVETADTAGVTGPQRGFAPMWLFEAETPLTASGKKIAALAKGLGEGDGLERLHRLKDLVADQVEYKTGATTSATTAEEALKLGAGVCQDHAHVFISAARLGGFPARYVSGYLMKDGEQAASHAWAEAHVTGLGWVGFDPSNRMSPDETYVTLATGRDYRDTAPVSGIRLGQALETLAVHITVEQ
ncbi:transglutaminase family protein [Mesorhizobium australicum]|uniref:Transglutaminase-like enzyme, putative cysteine protease n=1 Tax=Mesorhizobium australicum TaxID=536018 RepID=A0A1X7PAE0_9HYPH|nr:transglutaminase family protein [Mesorhizobium australicum]SMH47871.1 Transglutaminase-like enzyme, putative cysteine protease [Mesorhizobium australicum]